MGKVRTTLFKCICILVLMLCIQNLSARDYKSVAGDPTQTRIYTLDNGLRVYLSVNREHPNITAHIAVNTGHRNDPADCTGLAHYLEHLMFKGSHRFGTSNYEAEAPLIQKISDLYEEYRKLTDPEQRQAKYHEIDSVSQVAAQYNIPNEYDKLMAIIGSEGSNAYTWYDITNYTEDIPANEVQRWAEIQSDRFQNLVLRGFHTELEAVYEEKNMSLTDDGGKAFDALMAKLYPSHSYGTQTTIGTQDHLKNPSLVAINEYYNKYYKPNNIAICMAGDMDPDAVIAIIEKEFGSWQPGNDTAPRQFPEQPSFSQPQDTTVVGQEQEQVMLGWRFKGDASMQADTLALASAILTNYHTGLIDLNINQKMTTLGANADVLGLKDYSTLILSGIPKEGQTLEEVRDLMLAEVENLKAGKFDDDLITAIISNWKLNYMRGMASNGSRVNDMVYAFINGKEWSDVVGRFDRLSKITKNDVVAFARKYLGNGYAISYKRTGEDTNIKKVEKPKITPIPTNRDKSSDFLNAMSARKVEPIQPKFVDFNTELTKATAGKGEGELPILYVQNKENGLFTLCYQYSFGDRADVRYSVADDYIRLLGAGKLKNEQIKKQFYNLACTYNINVGNETIDITLEGLAENMPQAMALLETVINSSVPDKQVYDNFVANLLKEREEAKKNQGTCFNALLQYGLHGPQNDYTNILSEEELKTTKPSVFTDLIKQLNATKHNVLYYGPLSVDELTNLIEKTHKTAKVLNDVPLNREWRWVMTPTNEVAIAPYEANNIYLGMLNCENKRFNPTRVPTTSLFNEYFGGGMNAIVFQELRESRALAYSAWASYFYPRRIQDMEYWRQHIITQNDKMMDCINAFKEITLKMPQSEAAFDIAKQALMTSIATERTTKFGIINAYLAAQKLNMEEPLNKMIYEKLPSLTLQDINKFEAINVKSKAMRYIILGNESELDTDALKKIAPVIKRLTLKDIFGY